MQWLQSPTVLKRSGIAYLVLTIGFLLVMLGWDFQLIDELFVRQEILASLAALSDTQKLVHAITTATLDVAYPFAYGIFQAGMAYRYLGSLGRFIAPLSLLCIPVDLVEGMLQLLLLNGQLEFVDSKTVVTPIKLLLYLPGLCGALVALAIAAFQRKTATRS